MIIRIRKKSMNFYHKYKEKLQQLNKFFYFKRLIYLTLVLVAIVAVVMILIFMFFQSKNIKT